MNNKSSYRYLQDNNTNNTNNSNNQFSIDTYFIITTLVTMIIILIKYFIDNYFNKR